MSRAWSKLACAGLLAIGTIGATGCVAQKQYDDLQTLYRQSLAQQVDLQAKLEEANARIKALQEASKATDPEMMAKLQQAIAERNKLAAALADAEGKLRKSVAYEPVMLPAELDSALKELAASDPDLMSYDSALGMVRFRSDMTFALGSTEVSAKAQESLGKLAEILKRPVAQKYEARIVGHTDNVRIARAETKAKFPTNWHLSAGRSIAVKDVLEKDGIAAVRLGIAGYGEYRPMVGNAAKGGAEQNRRVEIYLVNNTYSGIPVGEAAAAPESTAVKEAAPVESGESFK